MDSTDPPNEYLIPILSFISGLDSNFGSFVDAVQVKIITAHFPGKAADTNTTFLTATLNVTSLKMSFPKV